MNLKDEGLKMMTENFDLQNKITIIAQKFSNAICIEAQTGVYPGIILDADKLYNGLRDSMIKSIIIDEENKPVKSGFRFRTSVSK